MSQNQELIKHFRRFLDPHVFIQYIATIQNVDQKFLQPQKVAALLHTRNIELIEQELALLPVNPITPEQLVVIKQSTASIVASTFTPELNLFIQQITEIGNVEQLSLEEVRAKFPNFGDKNQRISKQSVLKYINEKIVTANPQLIDQSYRASQLYYEMGQYEKSLQLLEQLKWFIDNSDRYESLKLNSLWGRIVQTLNNNNIIIKNLRLVTQIFDTKTTKEDQVKKIQLAQQDVKLLAQGLEQGNSNYVLKQRADLLTISLLLAYTSQEVDFSHFIEMVNQEDFQKILFTMFPNILSYYTISLLLSKNVDHQVSLSLEFLANLLNQNQSLRSTAVLEFIYELLWNLNFEKANLIILQLQDAQDILVGVKGNMLVENARILFFQSYIRIFSQIDIQQIYKNTIINRVYSKFLNCSVDDAEVWLVNAIRTQNLTAKIDGSIIEIEDPQMAGQNEQVMKLVKDIYPKTTMLVANLERFIGTK